MTTPMLIDTHCHLAHEPLCSRIESVLAGAAAAGVTGFVVPSVSSGDWEAVKAMEAFPGVATAFGVHPWKAFEGVDEPRLESFLNGACAVGEIGLDWKVEVSRQAQLDCLEIQLGLARRIGLPVLLHCRAAMHELLELLGALPPPGAVIHGFSRGPEEMRRFLDAGCVMGFGGAVTRPGAVRARASAAAVPAGAFVLETDSPWIGVEGGCSEPSSLPLVAAAMAGLRHSEAEGIAGVSTATALDLLGLRL